MITVAYNVLQSNKIKKNNYLEKIAVSQTYSKCIFEWLQMILYIDDHEAWKRFCSMNSEFIHDIQHQIQSNYEISQKYYWTISYYYAEI